MKRRKCKECGKIWYCEGDKIKCINLEGLDSCRCKTCWEKEKYRGKARQTCFSRDSWRIA